MLENIINNLKATVPNAFVNKKPSTPWINEKTKVIGLREIEFSDFHEIPIVPPIFIGL